MTPTPTLTPEIAEYLSDLIWNHQVALRLEPDADAQFCDELAKAAALILSA